MVMRNCLIHFFSEIDWLDFRFLELDALLEMNHIVPSEAYELTDRQILEQNKQPFLCIKLSDELIEKICQRSVLVKHIYELWGGKSISSICLVSTWVSHSCISL
jgi:hypothetical protein